MPGKLPRSSKIDQALAQARDLLSRGAWHEAEAICRDVLAKRPFEFDALHLLGVLRFRQGRPAEAEPLLGAALKVKPGSAQALSSQSAVLVMLERYEPSARHARSRRRAAAP
jgi:Flp pilus assembly protein TadD